MSGLSNVCFHTLIAESNDIVSPEVAKDTE